MRVIGVTSGKGGVGKTTVSVNLAVELAKRGKKVVLLDGDLGLSNAQILLNARVEYSYGHVLSGQKTLEEIMVQSEYGVTLVPGSSGSSALARLTRLQLLGLIHALSALDDCDYLVVDTAAGISDNVTVLFGACDIKLNPRRSLMLMRRSRYYSRSSTSQTSCLRRFRSPTRESLRIFTSVLTK